MGNKLFGFELKYQNPTVNVNSLPTAKYNGNISQFIWSTANDGMKRKYDYGYDKLNRLLSAEYEAKGASSTTEKDFYNESLTYDINGNIISLQRFERPPLSGSALLMDNLDYAYYNGFNSNRLKSVKDKSGNSDGYPSLVTANDIGYDDNGNMTTQADKGISTIAYNFLNLPYHVVQNGVTTEYLYRADGTKLKKSYGTGKVTDYLDGFQYELENGEAKLQFVPTSEGYYDFVKNLYIYNYVDHLGNVRLSYYKNPIGSAEALEENNYYPFGLKHSGYNNITGANPSYQYKYNGKELQETGMYDYGARFYMPDIGRWGVVDPKSELLESSSPYVYALNSPILYIDKDGELPILINGRVDGDDERANAKYWTSQIIKTIQGSGIPNPGGQLHFVDGDRYYNNPLRNDFDRSGEAGIKNGGYLSGNSPSERREAGYSSLTKQEFKTILSKLARNSEGKIIEKIQIYTHSRGAAFGVGYTERLLELIKENSKEFADANNVVDFVFNMAPHQSDFIDAPDGVDSYSMDHNRDKLSGNDMGGLKGAFSSSEKSSGFFGAHSITSFQKDISAFTSSFLKGGTSQQIINNFVQEIKKKYNITVTVSQ